MEEKNPEIVFPVFYRIRKLYWSPLGIYFTGIFVLAVIGFLFKGNQSAIFFLLFFCLIGYMIYRFFKSGTDYEILKGRIDGVLKFSKSVIEFEQQKFYLYEIEKISFTLGFIEGEKINSYNYRPQLDGQLSNGVENSVSIKFLNGNFLNINFQRKKSDDAKGFELILIDYCKQKKLSFIHLVSLLGIGYKDVQELKKEFFEV